MMMDIDAIYAEFLKKEQALDALLARCEAEQAAGKTGLDAWREADRLNKELQTIGQVLTSGIADAMANLSAGAG